MFCCCVENDVVSALVLWYDLVSFVRPADMMMFESDVARFCRDQRSFGEIDWSRVIGEHDGWFALMKSEIFRKLAPMDELFSRARKNDIFAFMRVERYAFFFCRVGAERRSCCTGFANGYLIGSVRFSIGMNIMGAIRGRMNFDAIGVIGWIRRECWADVGARFEVAK